MLGYIILALLVGGYNPALARVLVVDIMGVVVLSVGAILKYARPGGQ